MRIHKFTLALALLSIAAALYAVFYFKLYHVASDQDKTVEVILKSNNVRADFWQMVSAGAAAAAKEAGAGIHIEGPLQESDAETQIQLLEQAYARKPDAIVVAPINDSRIVSVIERIRSSDIRLVVIDTPLMGTPSPVSVLNDHQEAGRQAGRTAGSLTSGHPQVAVISNYASSGVSSEREKGVREAIATFPDSYTSTFYSEDSEDKAYLIARSLLKGSTRPNVIVALNEPAALGAAKAIKEIKAQEQVKLIGFDSSIYEIKLLEDGSLNALIVQKPFNMGYLGVKAALQKHEPKKSARVTYTDSLVITKSDMYTPENQKLLFPFDGK